MSLFQNRKLFEAASAAQPPARSTSAEKTATATRVSEFAGIGTGMGIHEVHRALREFQILLNTRRLYHHSHPKNLAGLEASFTSLQQPAAEDGRTGNSRRA